MTPTSLAAAYVVCVLAGSAFHKTLAPARAVDAAGRLLGRGAAVAASGVLAAGFLEVASALALLAPGGFRLGLAGAALVWFAYAAAALMAWARGNRRIDCGCNFGSTHRDSDVRAVAAKATALAALAVVLARSGDASVRLDLLSLSAGLTIVALGFATSQISNNRQHQGARAS
ncbi:MAG: hypothetical protein JSR28_19610 [Proteobacteria bacterium]|nr:hypothetical protein [Pseudomonadota bacterium]